MIYVINWVIRIARDGSTMLRQFILISNRSMDITDGGACFKKSERVGSSCKILRTRVQLLLYSGVIRNQLWVRNIHEMWGPDASV